MLMLHGIKVLLTCIRGSPWLKNKLNSLREAWGQLRAELSLNVCLPAPKILSLTWTGLENSLFNKQRYEPYWVQETHRGTSISPLHVGYKSKSVPSSRCGFCSSSSWNGYWSDWSLITTSLQATQLDFLSRGLKGQLCPVTLVKPKGKKTK